MIAKFAVQGFKSISREVEIECRPITLLFGPNSSGKSSLLQSLVVLNEVLRSSVTDVQHTELGGAAVDLGGLRRFASAGNVDAHILWNLTLERPKPDILFPRPDFDLGLEYEIDSFLYEDVPGLGSAVKHEGSVLLGTLQRSDLPRNASTHVFSDNPLFVDFVEKLANASEFSEWLGETRLSPAQIARVITLTGVGLSLTKAEATIERTDARGRFDELRVMGYDDLAELMFLTAHEVDSRLQDVAVRVVEICSDEHDLRDVATAIIDESRRRGDSAWSSFQREWRTRGFETEYGPLESFTEAFKLAYSYTSSHQLNALLWRVRDTLNLLLGRLRIATDSMAYLGPMRSAPIRSLSGVGRAVADTPFGESEWSRIANSEELRSAINEWLGPGRLNTGLKVSPQRLVTERTAQEAFEEALRGLGNKGRKKAFLAALQQNVDHGLTGLLVDERSGASVDVRDVGFGISQVVPVLARALGTKNKVHLIEQPEIHLHPALQANLADVFVVGSKKSKFVLETHSEHIILRLLRRIRETNRGTQPEGLTLTPTDIAVYYVSRTDDGSTAATRIEVAEDGTFMDRWPDGFFPDRLAELGS